MNSLSLVIYLADIVVNLRDLFIFAMISFGIVTAVFIILCLVSRFSYDWGGQPVKIRWPILAAIGFFIFGLIQISIPSKETILLIAGSEFSEQVVNTPEAKELLDGVRQTIKSQLEQYTKKE